LGLRAGEVVVLELDDIHWRTGVLTVRGKGRYHDRLPLPPDVGEAIAAYLQQDRPRCTTRRVFIRSKAPRRGFAHPSSISTIVCRALKRAGLWHSAGRRNRPAYNRRPGLLASRWCDVSPSG
jgi:integrase